MEELLRRIVVVEDDAATRCAVERLLTASGLHTTCFASAEALLAAGAVQRADCLILDVNLPGMSRFELFNYLQQHGYDVPVIFVTAYDEQSSATRAKLAGSNAMFIKPVLARSLLDAVDEAVGSD